MSTPNEPTAFGLSFKEHDARQMQHILRAYDKLPSAGANTRTLLYLRLATLERSLPSEEAQSLRDWLRAGGVIGDFPGPATAQGPPINAAEMDRMTAMRAYEEEDGALEWARSAIGRDDMGTGMGGFGSYAQPAELGGHRLPPPENGFVPPERYLSHDPTYHAAHTSESDLVHPFGPLPVDQLSLLSDGEESDGESTLREGTEPQNPDYDDDPPSDTGSTSAVATGPEKCLPADAKECHICSDMYGPEELLESGKVTPRCHHNDEHVVCFPCIRRYIGTTLHGGQLHLMTCLFCREKMDRDDVEKYGTQEMLARFEYLSMIVTPGLMFCLGLNCGKSQIHLPDGTNPIMTCNACGFQTCVRHKLPWHPGFTCEEYDRDESQIARLEADEATAKLLSQTSKVCPSCQQGVTKTEGCNHLLCRCGQEWCFECLASWDNIIRLGETAHARSCPFHPEHLGLGSRAREAEARRMAVLVHGGPVSDALAEARRERDRMRSAAVRPLAAEAAERRMKAAQEQPAAPGLLPSQGRPPTKKAKTKLTPAWEEK